MTGALRRLQLEFRTNRLERAFVQSARAVREWGGPIGRKYIERLLIVQAATSIEDLRAARSLRFHPLTGQRQGQYAMMLTGNWRLIVSFPRGEEGDIVRIEEVVDYHGG